MKNASVEIDGAAKSSIGHGLLVLAGFEDADTTEDLDWLSKKIAQLRIFNDAQGLLGDEPLGAFFNEGDEGEASAFDVFGAAQDFAVER